MGVWCNIHKTWDNPCSKCMDDKLEAMFKAWDAARYYCPKCNRKLKEKDLNRTFTDNMSMTFTSFMLGNFCLKCNTNTLIYYVANQRNGKALRRYWAKYIICVVLIKTLLIKRMKEWGKSVGVYL